MLTTKANNRLSLQLPATWSLNSKGGSWPSLPPEIRDSPVAPASSPERMAQLSSDSNAFLTALAKQERRVMELREELKKAEGELGRLKSQWATHEVSRKRNELRHIEPMRPLVQATRSGDLRLDPIADLNTTPQVEPRVGKRNSAPRKVFSGSKHTRTLSLLSPPLPQTDSKPSGSHPSATSISQKPWESDNKVGGLPSLREASPVVVKQPTLVRQSTAGFPTEDLVNTGKQLVEDLRDGLWTFLEDIRQAAAGEDAVSDERLKRIALQSKKRQGLKHKASFNSHTTPKRQGAGTTRSPQTSKTVKSTNCSLTPTPTQIRTLKSRASREGPFNGASQSKGQIKKAKLQPAKDTSDNDESQWLDGEDWENWCSPRSGANSPNPSVIDQAPLPRCSSLPKPRPR